MLLSYCIPAHKRTEDLLNVLPSVVTAANQSPPVEIVIVDYGNPEPLAPLLDEAGKALLPENNIIIKRYTKRDHYHMAHARNLSIKSAKGDYIIISATDIILFPHFFSTVREKLAETGADYIRSMTEGYIGVIACKRQEMLTMGGYDERFEFYGPEDKDFLHRLNRRGLKAGYYDLDRLISLIRTPDQEKIAHYRLPLSKKEMSGIGRDILVDNDLKNLIIANVGVNWGED